MRQLLTLALALTLCGCPAKSPVAQPPRAARQVTLALNWFPEAEHGGFFAALVHGYYEEEGLEVEIRAGGPGAPVIQQVASGQVHFAVANADQVLLGRDQGAPVAAVMTAMQDSPRCIMVHEETEIRSLLDLKGLTLAVGSGKPFAKYLLGKLDDAQLNIVPYQGSVAMFLQRSDFAQQAYVFSEPFVARQAGSDPHCLMVSDIGFNPYTSVLITNDLLVETDAELVRKFVRAAVRGWRTYLESPARTNLLIHERNTEMGLDILAFGARAIRPLCLPDDDHPEQLGQMTAERWRTLADQLVEIELLDQPDVWRAAYHTTFVSTP